MIGQGSPLAARANQTIRLLITILAICFLLTNDLLLGEDKDGARLRFTWGGGSNSVWRGKVEFPNDAKLTGLRILGLESEHSGRIYLRENTVHIDLIQKSMFGGFEIDFVPSDKSDTSSEIKYQFSDLPDGSDSSISDSFLLKQLFETPISKELPQTKNRVFISRSPGDSIKFLSNRESLVFREAEAFNFAVGLSQLDPKIIPRPRQLSATLRNVTTPDEIAWNKVNEDLAPDSPTEFQLMMPSIPGVYQLELRVTENSSIPFASQREFAKRTIEFVIVGNQKSKLTIDKASNLELVYSEEAGKAVRVPILGRIRRLEKINSSARDLIFKNIPILKGGNGKSVFSISPETYKTFPIPMERSQELLIFEIDFQIDSPTKCDIVLLDRWNKNQANEEVAATEFIVDEFNKAISPTTRTHRFAMWSRSNEPQLVVKNRSETSPCLIRQIRVYRSTGGNEEYLFTSNQNRRLFANLDAETVFENVSAPKNLDSGLPVDGWNRFYIGGERMVQLLKNSGYQGVVVAVNPNGSSLYPSPFLQPTPRLDTGLFANSASDPIRKDVLELLFQQFASNDLTLVPKIQVPRYIAKLESLTHTLPSERFDDLRLHDVNGARSTAYNALDPNVQEAVKEILMEVVERYSHHTSFGGVVIQIGQNDQLTFISNQFGYNESIIKKFNEDKPIQLVSGEKFNSVAEKIKSLHSKEFQKWRSEHLGKFFTELNDAVVAKSKKRLIVDTSKLVLDSEQQPPLLRGNSNPNSLLAKGITNESLAKSGLGNFHLLIRGMNENLADRKTEFAHLEKTFAEDANTNTFSNSIQRILFPKTNRSFENLSIKASQTNLAPNGLAYHPVSSEANENFRIDLVGEIAKRDCLLMIDNNELFARSLTSDSKRIWKTFTKLPNVSFDSITKNNLHSPVVVRSKSIGAKSYFYVVNQSPWPSRVALEFSTPLMNLRSADGKFFESLKKSDTGGLLVLDLEPYDLIVAESDQAELKISNVTFSLPDSLTKELTDQKDQLLARVRFLPKPKSIESFINPSFDLVNESGLPIGWNRSKDPSFVLRTSVGTDGPKSLAVERLSEKKWGWIRSSIIKPNRTGRLSLVVSMKNISSQPTPHVRLSLEGESGGSDYYRFGSFSAEDSQPESSKIENDWKVFAVHFDDVPTDLENLRVGLDVYGKGVVLVDHFRVFDNWFDAQDQEALSKIATLAGHKISEGELLHAHQLLHSYWPRFIREYVSQSESKEPEAPEEPGK